MSNKGDLNIFFKIGISLIVIIIFICTYLLFKEFFVSKKHVQIIESNYQKQMILLQKDVLDLKKENTLIQKKAPHELDDIIFPVVSFHGAGSKKEKDELMKKVINPYIDYNNEKSIEVITISLTFPANIEDYHEFSAIYKNSGSEGFIFRESKGQKNARTYDYWKPECLGECEFTDTFKAKHPQTVK